jgi:hypothetical protein
MYYTSRHYASPLCVQLRPSFSYQYVIMHFLANITLEVQHIKLDKRFLYSTYHIFQLHYKI